MNSMRFLMKIMLFVYAVSSCSKEIEIDIPGYEEQLVVDGRIEVNGFPVVILTTSKNIYSPSNFASYVESMVTDASVSVSNGSQTVPLELFYVTELPLETQKRIAEMLSLEMDMLNFIPFRVYSTVDAQIIGQLGESYTLFINWKGKSFQGTTALLPPVALDYSIWKPDTSNTEFGTCVSRLSDPLNEKNSYKWEVKNITSGSNGQPKDVIFRHSDSPFFSDEFFNGLSFEFETRYHEKDTTYPDGYKRHYRFQDSVVIKMSRVEQSVFEFFDKKEAQQSSNGNPFATPVNIPSNMNNGALGIWAGYSPWYDTLFCIP
jgi:hypothetical protein